MKANKITLEQSLLHEVFEYKDGELLWKKLSKKLTHLLGKPAGTIHHSGYRTIKINDVSYPAHRLIWLYHNGSIDENLQIDHIDGNKNNNSIENLRLITAQENCYNRSRLNSKGYTFSKSNQKWKATIRFNKITKYLGSFLTEQEAREAYLDACKKYHVIGLT